MARVKPKKNQGLIICPKTKQFTDIVVCAASCDNKCTKYRENITYEALLKYIEEHPEYKIIGELMATTKKAQTNEKKFWIIGEDNTVEEISEKTIIENPQDYIDKQIWQKPPFKYELVITLKKIKAD